MENAAAPLLDALAARATAAYIRLAGATVTANELLGWIHDLAGALRDAPFDLEAGHVVAVCGLHPRARIAAPIAAWSAGLSTYLVSDREPEMRMPAVLAEAGCRAYLEPGDADVLHWAEGPGRAVLPGPVSTLLSTSGSSGTPKIAVHALAQHLESARGAAAWFGLTSADRWLLTLPTWHVAGLGIVLRTMLSGAELCIPAFDAPLAHALAEHRPTHVSLVTTQLQRLLDDAAATAHLADCKAVLVGGGPIPVALRRRALDAGVSLVVSYGSTETSALVAASADPAVIRVPDTAGRTLPERRIEVDDAGRIRVGGPTLFRGYWVAGGIVDMRDEDGLFASGDIGALSESGVLTVSGRADRMFISGGENVHPEEIEAALLSITGVTEAVVVSVPSAEFGRRPVGFVRGASDAARIEGALRETLPGFKVPDALYALPRSPGRLKADLAQLEALALTPEALTRL